MKKITISLFLIVICGCLPWAILFKAASSSPCDPVDKIKISWSLYLPTSLLSTNNSSSTSSWPFFLVISIVFTIERPKGTTFLLYFLANCIATLTLFTFEANVVNIIFPGASWNIFSISINIFCSVGECSADMAFVESEIKMSIPSFPIFF